MVDKLSISHRTKCFMGFVGENYLMTESYIYISFFLKCTNIFKIFFLIFYVKAQFYESFPAVYATNLNPLRLPVD